MTTDTLNALRRIRLNGATPGSTPAALTGRGLVRGATITRTGAELLARWDAAPLPATWHLLTDTERTAWSASTKGIV
jgi:hypothetical protein